MMNKLKTIFQTIISKWALTNKTEKIVILTFVGLFILGLVPKIGRARNVYWMYGVVLDEARGMDAEAFTKRLMSLGVETRPFFLGMHEQPVLLGRGLFTGERYP